MGLQISVSGAAKLEVVAARLKAIGDKGLGRSMSKALTDTTKPFERAVRDEAGRVMPEHGGYRATFSASLRFRNQLRTSARSASLRFVTYAQGARQRRDVDRLDAGQLRHPVFGRSKKLRRGRRAGTTIARPWTVTTIRSGFYSRPARDAAKVAERHMAAVLDDIYDQLKG